MGKTTFTGPIRSGTILNTSGTTLGQDVANVGSVVVAQIDSFTQAGTATAAGTNIVIPANSLITQMTVFGTVAWDGASSEISIGTSSSANELVTTSAISVGQNQQGPGANATRTANWINTGTTDERIWVKSTNTGNGVGTLVVRYIPNYTLA